MRVALVAAVVLLAGSPGGAVAPDAAVAAERPPRGALIDTGVRIDRVSRWEPPALGEPTPDGRNLYSVAGFDGRSRVIVVQRDPVGGKLVVLPRNVGCVFHCSYADGLNNPVDVEVTPDGLDVIVANRGVGLSVYRRGRQGRLRMVS